MISGIAREILDHYLYTGKILYITKGLLKELVAVHTARVKIDWQSHHRTCAYGADIAVHDREQHIMAKVEDYIINKCRC